jgi:peroxiredoxin
MYAKYKDKGFEILGVSLDKEKQAWLQAIQQDGLTWKHVSDLKYWQCEAARMYNVTGIPMTFLIGKDGKIIGKNLRGPALENKLKELFN